MATNRNDLLGIFLKHRPKLLNYFSARSLSREEAEDLAQEAWIKLSRNGEAAFAAPIPYLMRIARSLAIDFGRGKARTLSSAEIDDLLDVSDGCATPEKTTEDRDQLLVLQQILQELPQRQRRMLLASRLENRRHTDIADDFGVSVRTVEMEIRKAIGYCGKRLDDINQV
jgi:RNA polymerase sigma factor (sigma-70 family)